MHEFSVISSIVDLVKQEMEKRPVILVKEVKLEVGELTFLAHGALEFGFTALVEKESKIANDALNIVPVQAEVKCKNCDYEGPMNIRDSKSEENKSPPNENHPVISEAMHVGVPIFKCPKCGGQIEVIKGKECTVANLRMELED